MIRALTCAALALSLTGCGLISRPVVSQPPARCASLIPATWSEGVEAAPVPQNDPRVGGWIGQALTDAMVAAIVAPWASAYVEQDGQLAKANGRTADTVAIVRQCEEMVNSARPNHARD